MRWIWAILCLLAAPATAQTVLYDWSEDACARWDIPDTPARFWREEGGVALVAGSESSRIARGPDPFTLSRDCGVVYAGGHDPDPTQNDDRAWIHSTWLRPDGRFEALAHVEYHGHRHGTCLAEDYAACWRNSVIALERTDAGRFDRRPGPPVAALPFPYDPAQTRRTGYFNPSNIFRDGDFLHVFVFAEASGAQARGACLLRRPLPGGEWRAWDGEGFAARLDGGPDGDTCAPVDGVVSTLSSVVADASGGWLAVTPRTVSGRPGLWLQRSDDLIHWTEPELLAALPLLWRRDCAAPAVYAYPALLAPESPSRNFDVLDGPVWLTAVRMPLDGACRVGPERDLVAWPLTRRAEGGFAEIPLP
ncbi:hypothetical protein LX81_01753 [Palleronia aestuarii]|uniref:BNR repeat neuraminidase n=1 Tax=Palleronia aestuarii TaxID=568105 RepID=A0A2W7NA52_9RHOB|nr:hypothetical protein [Palleronia aestuarii]PZX17121.1 hypothetical protein LX81_01753 [Palleronia aestuarii]